MNKILYALLLFICYNNSWADLGSLKVKSYLNQPFNAVVPVDGASLAKQSSGLSVNLATANKFSEYGLNYQVELAYLKFQIQRINDNKVNILITSTKKMTAPVLDLLLEYKANNISYYRQYTILLDPVNLVTTYSNKQNKLHINSVVHKKNSVELKSIPYTNNNLENQTDKNIYVADLNSPLIKNQIKNYNPNSNTYISVNDSLYTVAKFMDNLYNKSNLNISQFMLAIGLTNYQQLSVSDNKLVNGEVVKLPPIDGVENINLGLANQYLLEQSLTSKQKKDILTQIAKGYNANINITTPQMLQIKVQQPTVVKLPNQKHSHINILSQINIWWLSLLVIIMVSIYYGIRKFKVKQLADSEKIVADDTAPPVFSVVKNDYSNPLAGENIPNVVTDKILKHSIDKNNNDIDQELIQTLLDILQQDKGRNDIRVELLSVYVKAHNDEIVQDILSEIANYAGNDYNIINKSIKVASHYGYESIAREVLLNTGSNKVDNLTLATDGGSVK